MSVRPPMSYTLTIPTGEHAQSDLASQFERHTITQVIRFGRIFHGSGRAGESDREDGELLCERFGIVPSDECRRCTRQCAYWQICEPTPKTVRIARRLGDVLFNYQFGLASRTLLRSWLRYFGWRFSRDVRQLQPQIPGIRSIG